jgi:hypothetical protein
MHDDDALDRDTFPAAAAQAPVPTRHPVVVQLESDTGRIVIQAAESQVRAIEAALARRGLTLTVTSDGLCG